MEPSSTQKRTKVDFTVLSETYGLYYEQTANNNDWAFITNPLTQANFSVDLTEAEFSGVDISSTSFNSSDYDLVFDAAGTPYGYTGTTATALSSQGSVTLSDGVSVTVEAVTGKVKVNQ